MKKSGLFILITVGFITLFAENKLFVHNTDKSVLGMLISAIDSISFANNGTEMNIHKSDQSVSNYTISNVDSLTFGDVIDTVKIAYSGTSATITNPLQGHGVVVTQSGADVIVTSTIIEEDVKYVLSGTTTKGSVKIYSNYRFELILNGVSITNSVGPAINIQSSKRIAVVMAPGTNNSLLDGSTYSTSTEDQKAAFFSEGQLIFTGGGSLSVKSLSKHAICSDDYIQINEGNITVTGAAKDGIHSKDYFRMNGGIVNITATGDGIECEAGHVIVADGTITTATTVADTKGITCDSTMTITGGTITQTVGGAQSKGLKSKQAMTLSGGTITINTTGGPALSVSGSGYTPSYCTGVKVGTDLVLSGANVTIVSTGAAGKGISVDGNISMTAGVVNVTTSGAGSTYTNSLGVLDSYSSSCVDANGNIDILGGSLIGRCSGSASKGISTDGKLTIGSTTGSPTIYIKNSGAKLLVSGTANYTTAVYSEPKNIKSDGIMTIANGTIKLNATQQGANTIDTDSLLYITGGTITDTISGNQSKGIKSSRAMSLTGGTISIVASGGVTLENVAAATYDPSYCAAIKATGVMTINGSNITINHSGAGGKGLSGDADINILSGSVIVKTTGAGSTYTNSSSAADSYSPSCIGSDANLAIVGGTVTCSSSGSGGKGISTTGTITIGSLTTSPTITLTTTGSRFTVSGTDYCHPKTMVSPAAITINSGINTFTSTDDGIHSNLSVTINGGTNNITASSTTSGVGEGVESATITCNGGTTIINASNDGINATYGTVSGGTESDDKSNFNMNGGIMVVNGSDAVDSNGSITVTGGILIANGPQTGVEEGIDYNGSLLFNGGTVISAGSNSSMTKANSSTSTQPGMYIKSSSVIASTSLLHIENALGTEMVTFKPKNGGYYFHFTCPSLVKGSSYKIYSGGSYTGGSFVGNTSGYGMYTGGTYSTTGATLKSTSTLSTTSNTISY